MKGRGGGERRVGEDCLCLRAGPVLKSRGVFAEVLDRTSFFGEGFSSVLASWGPNRKWEQKRKRQGRDRV